MKKKEFWAIPEKIRHRIMAMIRKELDWFVHEKLSMGILFVLPLFLLAVVGNSEDYFQQEDTPIVYIIDYDNSSLSKEYINSMEEGNFSFKLYNNHENPKMVTEEKAEKLIPTVYLQGYIIIPPDFNESLMANRSATLKVYIDAINLLEMFQLKYEFLAGKMLYQVEYQVFNSEVLYYPEQRPERELSILVQVLPIMLPNIMFGVMSLVASQSIVADVPLKRMLISPARKYEIIIAKTLAYCFLGIILSFSSLLLLKFGFQVQFVSFIETFIITFAATLFGITFGLFFSSLAKNRLQAAQLFLFAYIMQVLIVNYVRIEPIVHFMPIEIISKTFTDIAYRGVYLSEIPNQLIVILFLNGLMLLLTYLTLIWKRRKI